MAYRNISYYSSKEGLSINFAQVLCHNFNGRTFVHDYWCDKKKKKVVEKTFHKPVSIHLVHKFDGVENLCVSVQ